MELNVDWQVVGALASAVAAGCAAFAAWVGPVRAAQVAETLRQKHYDESEERRVKLHVFASLLQDRRNWLSSLEGVRALNTVDLAFRKSPEVREAWARYQQTLLNGGALFPDHEKEHREDSLLAEMARDLGVGTEIRGSDLGRYSNPGWRSKLSLAQMLQAEAIIVDAGNRQRTAAPVHDGETAETTPEEDAPAAEPGITTPSR